MKNKKIELLERKDKKIEIKNPVEELRVEETIADRELGNGKHGLGTQNAAQRKLLGNTTETFSHGG